MAARHHRLFVYGTLMRGETSHKLLEKARFLAAACTEPRYRLIDMGAYPALLEGGGCSVSGELYEVPESTLEHIDRFEGHPTLYRRARVALAGGETAEAYFLTRCPKRGEAHPIPGGDWKKHRCRAS